MAIACRQPAAAYLRVHGRIERFVAPARRGVRSAIAFDGTPALKDPIEAAGIPHKEIGRVGVDGVDVPLATRLRGGESVDVYPVEVQWPGSPPRFVLDVHLGRLASDLRLLGIDTSYGEECDAALLRIAADERRVLLTRDVGLLKRTGVPAGAFVYATDPRVQLAETTRRFGLSAHARPLTRCSRCNGPVDPVCSCDVAADVPVRVLARATRFSRCRRCARAYWRGTHEDGIRRRFAAAGIDFQSPRPPPSHSCSRPSDHA